MFGGFSDDPFFNAHRHHMRQMQQMMEFPFGSSMGHPFGNDLLALTDGRNMDRHRWGNHNPRRNQRSDALSPMGMFDPFANAFGMMNNFHNMIPNMQRQFQQGANNPNGNFYTQSCVMSYSNSGNGQPQVYQATSSTTQLPGGVKETRKSVRDSSTGLEKMSIGRHIGDRGQVITRQRNVHTGDQEENKDFVNLDEEEEEYFNSEFQNRSRAGQAVRQHQPAISNSSYNRSGPVIEDVTDAPGPIIEDVTEYQTPKRSSKKSRRH